MGVNRKSRFQGTLFARSHHTRADLAAVVPRGPVLPDLAPVGPAALPAVALLHAGEARLGRGQLRGRVWRNIR